MEKWVTVTKRSLIGRATKNDLEERKATRKHHIYNRNNCKSQVKNTAGLPNVGKPLSSATLTKYILSTLSDESNPITHSDIYERTDHVTSTATGHQRSERRVNTRLCVEERTKKLAVSAADNDSERPGVLQGVRAYINGFLNDSTDLEIKRIVASAGGSVLYTPSGATHVITSQQLSSAKTQKLNTSKSRNKVHVVKPEWITDSIKAGKKLQEINYVATKDKANPTLLDVLVTKKASMS